MTAEHRIVRVERTIPATPERVYRAWLDPELLQQWLAPGNLVVDRVEIDERVGGHYRVWQSGPDGPGGGFECELIELVPGQRIALRWGFVGPDRTAGPVYDSRLTVELEDSPGGATKLTLVHERLEPLFAALPDVAEQVETGWELVLDKLATVAEAP